MAKTEVREGDFLTIRVPVRVTREDALHHQIVTVELFGQRVSGMVDSLDVVRHEKGNGWPG